MVNSELKKRTSPNKPQPGNDASPSLEVKELSDTDSEKEDEIFQGPENLSNMDKKCSAEMPSTPDDSVICSENPALETHKRLYGDHEF